MHCVLSSTVCVWPGWVRACARTRVCVCVCDTLPVIHTQGCHVLEKLHSQQHDCNRCESGREGGEDGENLKAEET